MYRQALKELGKRAGSVFSGDEGKKLGHENAVLVFSGFFYSRHIKGSILDKPLGNLIGLFVKKASR
jgi:hypothetical protein